MSMQVTIHNAILALIQGDITDLDTDAIVSAANGNLILGGGVAGAIRKKGGPAIQRECDHIGPINTGEAVITTGGQLKARFVIHAVGPRLGEGDEDHKLHHATLNALKLADREHLKTIAFPAISTGIFGYPIERCAEIMLDTAMTYLRVATRLEKVVFCLFSPECYAAFERRLIQEASCNKPSPCSLRPTL